jgi:acetylornithine deacetylase/succinyl-diaminopimelate desuccinylase-like protein
MRSKIFQLLLVVVLATSSLVAQQQTGSASAPEIKKLREHVEYLASAKLTGRRTGTEGATEAAEYIATKFEEYGLRGVVDFEIDSAHSSWSPRLLKYGQPFPYVAGVELGKTNAVAFTPRTDGSAARTPAASLDLRVGEDWMPLAWSANARVESSPVTYVGYGITAAELQHDDYAGVDLKGRIALAFAGTPDGDNPHGSYARFADLRFKAAAARDHGARALIIIAREENFKDDKLARLRVDESLASGDAGIPVVVISRQAARRALESAATPTVRFEELENALLRPAPKTETRAGGETVQPRAAQTARRSFSMPLKNIEFAVTTEIVRREAPAANVVGILEGSDPKLKNEVIVIGAHYDHLGHGGKGSLAAREGEIHHGADDNASGVAGLLELARTFARDRKSIRRTIVFIAFSGEEEGLLGSNYYVRKPVLPLAQTVAMINLDMIGRMRENKLNVGGVGTSAEWKKWIERANNDLDMKVTAAGEVAPDHGAAHGVPVVVAANGETIVRASPGERFALTMTEDGFGPSDHASFYAKQTPVLFFWTGTHEDYHKPTDTADRINYEGEQKIVAFVASIVRAVDASDTRPTYTLAKSDAAAGRSTGFRVYLGTIPNYGETSNGMKLDGVREDSPAAKAGLKAGDVIMSLAGREVRNVYDYTYALGEMQAGVEYDVEVMRGGERIKLKLTPTARR